jgi:hypothetical protein
LAAAFAAVELLLLRDADQEHTQSRLQLLRKQADDFRKERTPW